MGSEIQAQSDTVVVVGGEGGGGLESYSISAQSGGRREQNK